MSEGITPVNWGRQADRLVTAGIILGATTLGFFGGKESRAVNNDAPIIIPAPKVVNEINVPVPEVNNEFRVPKDAIVVKSEVTHTTIIEGPIKCQIVGLPEVKAVLLTPLKSDYEKKEKKIEKVIKKVEVKPQEGGKFPAGR